MIGTIGVRLGVVTLAVLLSSASVKKRGGAARTGQDLLLHEPRPRFNWPHREGATYRVVLYQLTRDPATPRRLVHDELDHGEPSWRPPEDLAFDARYELYVYDGRGALVTSWGFTIGFEEPRMISPAPAAEVNSLSPELRIAPLQYPSVVYRFDLAEDASFESPLETGSVVHAAAVREFAGPDAELGTADDVRYVPWQVGRVLAPGRTYHWRVEARYFPAERLQAGAVPGDAEAIGSSTVTGTFTIPPATGTDALAHLARVFDPAGATTSPALNRRLELAYVTLLPEGGAEIRVAEGARRAGRPVFTPGDEPLTRSVQASSDLDPQWDADGKGLYFASDRSNRISNIWHKRRDARGYTQLTFHAERALHPTVSKDGARIAYQVADAEAPGGWSIWIVDRDGRSPTRLATGEAPRFSPDGERIAFARPDHDGALQLWVMDARGKRRRQLTHEAKNTAPAWHPDGKRLVFVSDRAGNPDLWLLELDGGRTTQLTGYQGADTAPAFTPDGRRVLFATTREGDAPAIWIGDLPR